VETAKEVGLVKVNIEGVLTKGRGELHGEGAPFLCVKVELPPILEVIDTIPSGTGRIRGGIYQIEIELKDKRGTKEFREELYPPETATVLPKLTIRARLLPLGILSPRTSSILHFLETGEEGVKMRKAKVYSTEAVRVAH